MDVTSIALSPDAIAQMRSQFLFWEQASRDTIDFKKAYVDMAGDLVAGLVLSQVIYWHLPGKNGVTKLQVSHDGYLWIAKKREEWWDEIRISPKMLDRALAILEKLNLIVTALYHFNSKPVKHIRLNWDGFINQFQGSILTKGENRQASILTKGKNPILPKVKILYNIDYDQRLPKDKESFPPASGGSDPARKPEPEKPNEPVAYKLKETESATIGKELEETPPRSPAPPSLPQLPVRPAGFREYVGQPLTCPKCRKSHKSWWLNDRDAKVKNRGWQCRECNQFSTHQEMALHDDDTQKLPETWYVIRADHAVGPIPSYNAAKTEAGDGGNISQIAPPGIEIRKWVKKTPGDLIDGFVEGIGKDRLPAGFSFGPYMRFAKDLLKEKFTREDLVCAGLLVRAWVMALPASPQLMVNVGEGITMIRQALGLCKRGVNAERVTAFVKAKYAETDKDGKRFWAGKLVKFEYACDQIGAWEASRKPKVIGQTIRAADPACLQCHGSGLLEFIEEVGKEPRRKIQGEDLTGLKCTTFFDKCACVKESSHAVTS